MWVESTAGVGSTFHFTIRAAPATLRPPAGAQFNEPQPNLAGRRLLVVDDDPVGLALMESRLSKAGYEVRKANNGQLGLDLAKAEKPDLVILDMMMPKRSGFLVLEKLRRTRPVPIRVVMITANEGSRHKAYAETLGVDDYIRKPYYAEELVAKVRLHLPRRKPN